MKEKVAQLQLMEHNLQSIAMQKQNFQAQLLEIENASKEIKNSKEVYKILGTIMIKSNQESIEKDLKSKKDMLNLRIKNIEKQESQLKERAKSLQEEVMKEIKWHKKKS